MTVKEIIEYLKTLDQDAKLVVGDPEYPDTELSEDSFSYIGNNTYRIY